jgi:hypothetical protein
MCPEDDQQSVKGCGSCGACPLGNEPVGPWQGWRLVGIAAAFFLWPLILALVGAIAIGESRTGQTVGAFTGLALGMGSAVWIGHRWIHVTPKS